MSQRARVRSPPGTRVLPTTCPVASRSRPWSSPTHTPLTPFSTCGLFTPPNLPRLGQPPASQLSVLSGPSPWTPFRPTARHTAAKPQRDQPTLSGSPITHGREALEPRVLLKLAGKANTQSATMHPEQQSVRLLGDPALGCPHSLLRGASHPLTSPWHCPHHTDTGGAPDWEHPGQGLTFYLLQAGLGPEPRTWCGEFRQ